MTITWRVLDNKRVWHSFMNSTLQNSLTLSEAREIIKRIIQKEVSKKGILPIKVEIDWPKVGNDNFVPLKWHKMSFDYKVIKNVMTL